MRLSANALRKRGFFVKLDALIGVFGGPEFLVHYPNGDVTYYTTTAFRGSVVGGSHEPGDGELVALEYFSQSESRVGDVAIQPNYFQPGVRNGRPALLRSGDLDTAESLIDWISQRRF